MLSSPVAVPEGFVGLCTSDLANAPSTITHALVRSWDYRGTLGLSYRCVVKNINPSAGVYVWDALDSLLSNNVGKDVIFTLGIPADYLVSRAAIGGTYLGGKSNMCPDDMTGWVTAVQAIVSRVKNTHGRTGLKWELWNEIDQTSVYADPISLLGPYTKATVEAIRDVDPSAVILSPSIAGPSAVATLQAFLAVSDGAGGKGGTWCDAVSAHYYNMLLYAYEHPTNYAQGYSLIRAAIKGAGFDLPVWITESGFMSSAPNIGLGFQRRMLVFAALGAKCFLGYSYDSASFPVSPYTTEWNVAANILKPGAVISRLVVGVSGLQVTVDGRDYMF